MKNYLTCYKVGDYVDIKVDGSQHKVKIKFLFILPSITYFPFFPFSLSYLFSLSKMLGNAIQILPRKNRKGVQREPQIHRCDREQTGRKQNYPQENPRQTRAHQT